jgi:hypothetical protein
LSVLSYGTTGRQACLAEHKDAHFSAPQQVGTDPALPRSL